MDPVDRDLAIRTVLAEAGGQGNEGMAAVASVIRNRMAAGKYGGRSAGEVVTAKNQFEPWNDVGAGKANDPMAYAATDPAYQRAGQIVDGVFSGAIKDPTGGATHFYAPKAQAALGRKAPKWAAGQQGRRIGDHVFYAPDGTVSDLSQGLGEISQTPGAPATSSGPIRLPGLGAPPQPQQPGSASAAPGALTSQDLLRMFMGKMGAPAQAAPTHGALNTLLFGPQGWQGKLGQSMPNGLLGALGGMFGGGSPAPAAGAPTPLTAGAAASAPGPGTLPETQAPPVPTAIKPDGSQITFPQAEGPGSMGAGGAMAPAMPQGGGGQSPMDLLKALFGAG